MTLKKLGRKVAILITMVLTVNTCIPTNILAQDTTTKSKEDSKLESESSSGGTGGSSGGAVTKVYNCIDGDCCECSNVLGSFIEKILSRRIASDPTIIERGQYGEGEFKDDLREGIHEAIKNGSAFDLELAKYEMATLLEKYGDTTKMNAASKSLFRKKDIIDSEGNITGHTWETVTVSPITARDIVEGYTNCFLKKYEETNNWDTAAQESANQWNTALSEYITFNKSNITISDIQSILINVGITGASGKSLEEMKNYLKHTHDSSVAGVFEDCECKHVCSLYQRPFIQSQVKTGTIDGNSTYAAKYNHYIEAQIVTSNPSLSGLVSENIKIPVKQVGTTSTGKPFYAVAECVCRLGVEIIITPATLTPNWTEATNYIQPEGLTNIGIDIKFDEKCRDVSYVVSLDTLVNEKLDGNELMSYDFSQTRIQIKKMGSIPTILDSKYYTPSYNGSELKIKFNEYTSTDVNHPAFYADKDEIYRINIYIPTKVKSGIKYAPIGSTTDNYMSQYIKLPPTNTNKTQDISTKLIATVRVSEAITIDYGAPIGIINHPEAYNVTPTTVLKDVTLTYWEMPKIN